MKPGMWLAAGAVFLGAFLAAPAQAAVTVIGSGLARECYLAVEKGVMPSVKALGICDTALETETLSRKNRASTYVNRGILHMRMGNHARALADFNTSIVGQADLYEAYVNRGAALFGLDRYEEALADFDLGVRSENLDARVTAYYDRGLVYERLGNITSAYYDYKAALELQPDFALATKQLSRFQVTPVN